MSNTRCHQYFFHPKLCISDHITFFQRLFFLEQLWMHRKTKILTPYRWCPAEHSLTCHRHPESIVDISSLLVLDLLWAYTTIWRHYLSTIVVSEQSQCLKNHLWFTCYSLSAPAPGSHWSPYCLHRFVFSRMSYPSSLVIRIQGSSMSSQLDKQFPFSTAIPLSG